MTRRLHVADLRPGLLPLDPAQSHHARHVLRLGDGDAVELFDAAGAAARGVVVAPPAGGSGPLAVRVDAVDEPPTGGIGGVAVTVAAAVPKGERADWMVEKLSELGVAAFVPLATDRSVVAPKGTGKRDRWVRLATESAKQCRRRGVMRIDPLAPVEDVLAGLAAAPGPGGAALPAAWFLDTGPSAVPARAVLLSPDPPPAALTVFVGPEGGWTPGEVGRFRAAGLAGVSLGRTVLRVETAAVAAAACVAAVWAGPVEAEVE